MKKEEKEEKKEFILAMEELRKEFPDIGIEKREDSFVISDNLIERLSYTISNIKSIGDLDLIVRNKSEIENIKTIINDEFELFDDFFAIKSGNKIEIFLNPINVPFGVTRMGEENSKDIFEVKINYYRNELAIKLQINPANTFLSALAKQIRGFRSYRRKVLILTIENLKKPTSEGLANDVRNIIYSVLFDIEYTYGLAFETVNIESYLRRNIRRRVPKYPLPQETINLIYKKYIPELVEYYHIGEKVDFLPFKFICYYHIIEYFSDKSAYYVVANKLKDMLLKPDFHEKTNKYVGQAINFFKKESDRNTGDKIKVDRVLRQFVDRTQLKEYLEDSEVIEHFKKECSFDCNRPLKLPELDFDKDGNFYSNLTKRIYTLRCSIVHSNPDFDDTKAIPFNPTPSNLDKLRTEIEMVLEIARMIITGSREINQ